MNDTRWLAVATTADAIEAQPKATKAQLETLLERFGPELDPVEHFEAWALRQLVRALLNSNPDFQPR